MFFFFHYYYYYNIVRYFLGVLLRHDTWNKIQNTMIIWCKENWKRANWEIKKSIVYRNKERSSKYVATISIYSIEIGRKARDPRKNVLIFTSTSESFNETARRERARIITYVTLRYAANYKSLCSFCSTEEKFEPRIVVTRIILYFVYFESMIK